MKNKIGEENWYRDIENDEEKIICSAVLIEDGKEHNLSNVRNKRTGFVVCGRRHGDCYKIIFSLIDQHEPKNMYDGFLTNFNRWVDRKEGFLIAKKQGQIQPRSEEQGDILFSEDLY